jgi:hypothetical protein
MLPTDRLAYSAITDRPRLMLPGNARVAIWVIVNVEEWDPKETMPRTVLTPPAGGAPIPDIPNWAWHEYGNRVGFWRMLEVLDQFHIKAALAINGKAIATYEPISRAAHDRGWEFIGHGFGQKNMQKVADEREDIRKTRDAIRKFTKRDPRGWLGPGLTETWETPDILVEEGFDYVCDWVCAVQRRRFPVGASPTRQPLQPEAIGAVMEVTKWLKPSISVSRIGDSASVQAATRVNAEQSSKRTMRRSTRQPYRGRLIRLDDMSEAIRSDAAPG